MNEPTIDDGGPAFPVPPPIAETDGVMTQWRHAEGGMTLRDYFAGQALNGIYSSGDIDLSKHTTENPTARSQLALLSYRVADAMLAARKPKTL